MNSSVSGQTLIQGPRWRFSAADGSEPADGCFTTDNANAHSTTGLKFRYTDLTGSNLSALLLAATIGSFLLLVGANGVSQLFQVNDSTFDGTTYVQIDVGQAGASGAWAGVYSVSFVNFGILANILAVAGITPAADATTTPVTSITTKSGVVTAKS